MLFEAIHEVLESVVVMNHMNQQTD